MAEIIVGIDLGTSNCVVAHADGTGEVRTLADDAGYKIHPSVVSFLPSGGVVVGAEAKQRKVIDPQNTIYSAKRLIGRSFRSPEVQQARSRMPYQIREGANQLPLISTRAGEFAIPEVSAVLLDHVRNVAARALGAEVSQAVITVPANFNDAQRSATATAGAIAGITVVRVLNEPTAAALAYGHTRQLKQTIAVYDFGGGTFDVTILRLDEQVYEVLGTAGDSFLGGDDLDERLVDKMVERFLAEQRIDLRTNEVAMMRLRAVAEQTKIELSRRQRAVVRIDEIAYGARGAPLNLQIEVTRDEFVGMVSDIIQRTFPVCQDALKLAGLGVSGVDDIVLVGGTTKVPAVRDQVAKFFARAPRNDINPEEAVAIGAALQADSLQRILARAARPSATTAVAGGYSSEHDETTAQSQMPGLGAVGEVGAMPRPKRETADLGSAGMRPFSERPGARGLSVDRYESKGAAGAGRLPGTVTTPGTASDVGSTTGTTAIGRPPLEDFGESREQQTATRPSYVDAPSDEESTAARLPVNPEAGGGDETSTAAPLPVRHEATNSSMNPVATGRRPAPPQARGAGAAGAGGMPGMPPPLAPPPAPPAAAAAAARRRSGQQPAQPPPLPPPSGPLPPVGPPPGAGPGAPTMMQPAQAPPAGLRGRAPSVPPPVPAGAGTPRVSRPRITVPGGAPVRDSMPAIDPDSQVQAMPTMDRPMARPNAELGLLGEEPSTAASTAQGMTFPADPAVTARGLVPNVPSSLAGQSSPSGLAAAGPGAPLPSTTARGVAPAAPTMMIGGGLASSGPASPQQRPSRPAPPSQPPAMAPLPTGPAGPQARTMIAQQNSTGFEDERFPPPAPPPFGGGYPPPGGGFAPPGPSPNAGFDAPRGYGAPEGGAGYPPPAGGFGPPGPPGFAGNFGPVPGSGGGGYGPPGIDGGFGAPGQGPPGPGQYAQSAPPGPAGGFGPPGPPGFAGNFGPIPGGSPDAFGGLPSASPGGTRTPMPFAQQSVRRPGDDAPFFSPTGQPLGGPHQPSPMAAMQATMQAMPAPVVLDVTPFGLGIGTVAGYCEELIRRNTRVPTEIRRSFSTSRDGQDVVRIVVCQGESRRIEENVQIGELVLAELPRRPRGETTIEVAFAIDASGILHVRARDAASGREQRASLNVIGTIPEGDVAASRDRMAQLRR